MLAGTRALSVTILDFRPLEAKSFAGGQPFRKNRTGLAVGGGGLVVSCGPKAAVGMSALMGFDRQQVGNPIGRLWVERERFATPHNLSPRNGLTPPAERQTTRGHHKRFRSAKEMTSCPATIK